MTRAMAVNRAWRTELEAEDFLAEWLETSGYWRVFRQVMGRALWAPCPAAGRVRADILAVATRRARQAGWEAGAIVFEVKRSARTPGRAFVQLLDYLESAFTLPGGVEVLPAFGFLFAAPRTHGPIASVLAQNRAGTAELVGKQLHCYAGEQRVLSVSRGGDLHVGNTSMGRKFGSRQ